MLQVILHHNPTRSYSPGDTVRGRLIVDSQFEQAIMGIKIKIQGFAGVKKDTNAPLYANIEWYVKAKQYIVGDGSKPIVFSGRIEREFNAVLPPVLPPSFDSPLAKIIYQVVAVVKRPLNIANTVLTRPFIVEVPVDLNKFAKAPLPAEMQKGKTVGMVWNKSGEIGLHVKIPKRGYTGGETMPVEITVKNMSSKQVKAVRVYLVQEREYNARSKILSQLTVVAHSPLDGLAEYQGQAVRTTVLEIPSGFPPTGPAGSSIIRFEYKLRVVVVIPGNHLNLRAEIPVLMGTVPLRAGATPIVLGYTASAPEAPQSRVDAAEDLEPPSYDEAMSGDTPSACSSTTSVLIPSFGQLAINLPKSTAVRYTTTVPTSVQDSRD